MIAVGLTALLAIVAAASRGHRAPPGGRGAGPSDTLVDYLLSTYLVISVVVFAGLMVMLIRDRETLPTRRQKRRELRQLVQFGLVMVLLFFGARYIVDAFDTARDSGPDAGTAQTTQRRPGKQADRSAPARDDPSFRWEPVAVLAILAAGAAALYGVNRARRRQEPTGDEFAEALADVLDDALGDLRAEQDPRRAVIAAYARMERLLAAYGAPRRPSEAPFEYLGRVLVELQASSESVFELTALFERAKFSAHSVDDGMKEEAIVALADVRDELRGAVPA